VVVEPELQDFGDLAQYESNYNFEGSVGGGSEIPAGVGYAERDNQPDSTGQRRV
jgi:hypothetical protein